MIINKNTVRPLEGSWVTTNTKSVDPELQAAWKPGRSFRQERFLRVRGNSPRVTERGTEPTGATYYRATTPQSELNFYQFPHSRNFGIKQISFGEILLIFTLEWFHNAKWLRLQVGRK